MPKTPEPQDVKSNGDRLGDLRREAKQTQQQLADASGYSLATVQKYEQNLRVLDRGQVILTFARALGVHPAAITGHPFHTGEHEDNAAASATVAAVHRALLVHGRPPRVTEAEVAAVDLADLAQRVSAAIAYRHAAAMTRTADVLPDLLRDLQVAALVTEGDQRRRAHLLLARGYECAMQFAYKMGHGAVSTLATERVMWAAQETGDPLQVLASHWYESGEFIAIGEHDVAADIIDDSLRGLARLDRTPEAVSLTGAFHLKAALNSARAADATESEMRLRQAQAAAEDLGRDENHFDLQFGPSNVAVWGVSIPVEFGRGREAVRRGERVALPTTFAAERRCHLQIDLGRAHWQNGNREGALVSFLNAEEIAPVQTRLHSAVRETLRSMRRQQRRGRLAELCLRVGVV
ncbi:helix-turn-helix transcriptional regulator [Nonomuraea sp. NPDC026600]|uniref:helix-turn-helix domain-containing protein n=1 Tax=Nonomuraea sp. NPDC026600 TaxID=3155363 RepID=UPI0033E3CD8A